MKSRKRQLYVEGGGDHNPSLATECRKAFSKLFERAGISRHRRPGVIVCGGRKNAYDQFCQALKEDTADVWLLVDAEDVVASGPPFEPWAHVAARPGDGWARPANATDDQLQLMAIVTETWLVTDQEALSAVFGPKLDASKLPPADARLEQASKTRIYEALARSTQQTPGGPYGKGAHSFKILERVAPGKLRVLSWAARFLDEMGKP